MTYKERLARARKRRVRMQALRDARYTFKAIGKMYGISWQRVQQILNPGKRP